MTGSQTQVPSLSSKSDFREFRFRTLESPHGIENRTTGDILELVPNFLSIDPANRCGSHWFLGSKVEEIRLRLRVFHQFARLVQGRIWFLLFAQVFSFSLVSLFLLPGLLLLALIKC
jgi:hypothetical protein